MMRLLTTTRSMLRWAIIPLVLAILSVGTTTEAQQNLQQRIQAKANEAQKLAKELFANGEPPLKQIARLKTVPDLAQQGKFAEIESLLDEVLSELKSQTNPKSSDVPTYTAFKNPRKVAIRGYDAHAMEPFLSRDGKVLFFNTGRVHKNAGNCQF
tara:strand:+ start:151 stop:615 length:465 start_codon:yes stop_codon:yes gene_type:complete